MKHRFILSIFLVLTLLTSVCYFPAIAAEAENDMVIETAIETENASLSGTIGESSVTWLFHSDSGLLEIGGMGPLEPFSSSEEQPWAGYREQIKQVFIFDSPKLSIIDLTHWFDGLSEAVEFSIPSPSQDIDLSDLTSDKQEGISLVDDSSISSNALPEESEHIVEISTAAELTQAITDYKDVGGIVEIRIKSNFSYGSTFSFPSCSTTFVLTSSDRYKKVLSGSCPCFDISGTVQLKNLDINIDRVSTWGIHINSGANVQIENCDFVNLGKEMSNGKIKAYDNDIRNQGTLAVSDSYFCGGSSKVILNESGASMSFVDSRVSSSTIGGYGILNNGTISLIRGGYLYGLRNGGTINLIEGTKLCDEGSLMSGGSYGYTCCNAIYNTGTIQSITGNSSAYIESTNAAIYNTGSIGAISDVLYISAKGINDAPSAQPISAIYNSGTIGPIEKTYLHSSSYQDKGSKTANEIVTTKSGKTLFPEGYDLSSQTKSYKNYKCRWIGKQSTVSFEPNGAAEPAESVLYVENETVYFPTYTRSGYSKAGWRIEKGDTFLTTSGSSYTMPSQDITVKALWKSQTPTAPTVVQVTTESISVAVVTGQEYSIDSGRTWQDSGLFSELESSTEYRIVTRVKATENVLASNSSSPLSVFTCHTFTYGSWSDFSDTQHRRARTCSQCGYSDYEYADHKDTNGNTYCNTCNHFMTRFSVTVPTSLMMAVSRTGQAYAADNAQIVNNSTGAVKLTKVMVTTANGWRLAPYTSSMAGAKVDSKQIGFRIAGTETTSRNTTEALSMTEQGSIPKGGALPLDYSAVLTAMSQPVNEQVLTVEFTVDWAA